MSAGEGAERGGPPAPWVGMEVGAAPVENSREVPQQTENSYHTDPATPLLVYTQKKLYFEKIYPCVQSSTINNNQDMEAT